MKKCSSPVNCGIQLETTRTVILNLFAGAGWGREGLTDPLKDKIKRFRFLPREVYLGTYKALVHFRELLGPLPTQKSLQQSIRELKDLGDEFHKSRWVCLQVWPRQRSRTARANTAACLFSSSNADKGQLPSRSGDAFLIRLNRGVTRTYRD